MELDSNDYDIVKLLTKLKHADFAYPPGLLASRRQKYIRRVAEVGAGSGVAAGLKNSIGKSGSVTPTAGRLLEIALVAVILVEAGSAAYIYRDKISKIFQSYSSKAQVLEGTSPPETLSPAPEMFVTKSPDSADTPTATETLEATAMPDVAEENNQNNGGDDQANSTPDPNGDNGNHFGQTPKPERTHDPGDNNNDEHGKEQTEGSGGTVDH